MKKYYVAILIFLLSVPGSYVFANLTDDVSIKLQNIGLYLNHQNFKKAQELRKEIMKDLSVDTLSKNLSYEDFITLLQTISWDITSVEYYELIRLRELYHPEDTKNAALLSRKDRTEYWKNCSSNKVLFLDQIDWAMCIIYNDQIEFTSKKIQLRKFISKNYPRIIKSNDLQAMSDLGNLISTYSSIDPEKSKIFATYQKKLGFQIIQKDPAWVNGYFFMIANSSNRKEKNSWINKLSKNYIGDNDRWLNVVVPYIDSYK